MLPSYDLAIQRLCIHLGEPGKNLRDDIGQLVAKKGLSAMVQQSLDTVRIVGNNAVHPGTLNFDDNIEIAQKLFLLVNIIVDATITQPKQVSGLFSGLPQGALDDIAKRDAPKT